MIAPADLEAMWQRWRAARHGEWKVHARDADEAAGMTLIYTQREGHKDPELIARVAVHRDAVFLAAAQDDLRRCLEEIEAMRLEFARLREAMEREIAACREENRSLRDLVQPVWPAKVP